MANGLHQLGAASLLQAFRAGRASTVAATRHYLDRIDRFDPALGAFTHVDREGALAAAAESAARHESGNPRPLEGLPVAVKANIAARGMPAHAGIGALRAHVADADSDCVAALRASGAVILGLTNMHEAALGATTDNPHFGRTHNPHRIGHTPGGSSGGSAAAVAAGLAAAALGTDTLGSIRIPSAWCGVTGLKPTNGLVPVGGLVPLVPGLDCIGPIARSVADCALLLSAIARPRAARPLNRVARLEFRQGPEPDSTVSAALRLSASLLQGLGLAVETRQVRVEHARLRLAAFLEVAQGAADQFGKAAAAEPEGFSADFHAALAFARSADGRSLADGRRALEAAANELQAVLHVADALLLPTTPQAAFPFDEAPPQTLADYSALANLAGLPALSLPAGWTADGLPIGVQLIGRAGEDMALLELGGRLEAALNAWRPPLDPA
ncbi:amidase [Sandaracinobacter sp. RS1-74]|uniref:amidase n=1 Tax=Sandaracinobacteroides sayramensis TaxID=2913411 RepID=UPI001EDB7E93|nr:amidase [Sandaracinobacteroides sayramensis]MCG2842689.1 amidase [Sandaracinobacteroides sayramensis]